MQSETKRTRGSQRFPKSLHIRARADFRAAQAQGRRATRPHIVLLLRRRNDQGPPRLGITTSRKVGSAVVRNRIRRWVREVFRTHRDAFPNATDCVVIARDTAASLEFAGLRDELLGALAERPRRERTAEVHARSSRDSEAK